MKRLAAILVFVIVSQVIGALLVLHVHAQEPTAPLDPRYQATEAQSKDLMLAEKDRVIAQQEVRIAAAAYNAALEQYQAAMKALTAVGDKVRADNNWPSTVTLDPNFTDPRTAFHEPPAAPNTPHTVPVKP